MHVRKIFDLGEKKQNSRQETFKIRQNPKFGLRNAVNTENIALRSLQVLYIFVLRAEIVVPQWYQLRHHMPCERTTWLEMNIVSFLTSEDMEK